MDRVKVDNVDTLVLGLEHFIDKIGYQAEEYCSQGINARYLVLDKSGRSQAKAKQYGADVCVLPASLSARLSVIIREFVRLRPVFVELYDIGRMTFLYAILSKVFNCKLILILRGSELWGRERGRKPSVLRKYGLRTAIKLADRVIAKEENILVDLKRIGIPSDKVEFLGNCVPTPKEGRLPLIDREIDLLFLNSVRRWRNVSFLIKVIRRIIDVFPTARVIITGFTSLDDNDYKIEPEYEKEVLKEIENMGLSGRIVLEGFVGEPHNYHRNAKIFVLPADIIYANYSLLESMSHGAIPIVADGEGAGRIVEDGVSGRIIEKDPDKWAEAILAILNDPESFQVMSDEACKKINREFSITSWVRRMVEIRTSVTGGHKF